MKNKKWSRIYWKLILKYMVGFLLILLPCIMVVVVSWNVSKKQMLTSGQLRVEEGVETISLEISKMRLLVDNIQRSEKIANIAEMEGSIPWGKYLELSYARNELSGMRYLYKFSPYFFMLFSNNDFFISTYQCEDQFSDDYYGTLMEATLAGEDLDAQSFRQHILNNTKNPIKFLKLDQFVYCTTKIVEEENTILCVANRSYVLDPVINWRMCYVIPAEQLVDLFLTEKNRESGFVRIVDGEGQILLDYGDVSSITSYDEEIIDVGTHWMISVVDKSETNWTVQIGLPKDELKEQMYVLYAVIIIYAVLGLIIVIWLSFYFGNEQYGHLKKFYLNSLSYMRQIEEMEKQRRAIRLETLIVDGINTQEDREELRNADVISSEFYCVALVRMNVEEEKEYAVALMGLKEYLNKNWSEHIFYTHTGTNEELFIFSIPSNSSPDVSVIKRLFEEVSSQLKRTLKLLINVGISAVGTDIANLKRCYAQANQVLEAYYQKEMNSVHYYRIEIDNSQENIINMDLLNQIYQSIIRLNKDELKNKFRFIKAYYCKNRVRFEVQKEQCFYAIRNVIYNASLYLSEKTEGTGAFPIYEKSDNADIMIEKLYEAAETIINLAFARKNAQEEKNRAEILAFMEQNYANKNMSVVFMCEEFGISERYLQEVVREATGDTFAVKLEKLRVNRALELLGSTDYNNEQIADAVGFTAMNTFYRVFKKHLGLSPKAFREDKQQSGI